MPYVNRNKEGQIISVSMDESRDCKELVGDDDLGLMLFLKKIRVSRTKLEESDFEIIRVIEDLINLLIEKNVIMLTDFPQKVQEKLEGREKLRIRNSNRLNLLGDEDGLL